MAESSLSSRHPMRLQVLHSELAESRQPTGLGESVVRQSDEFRGMRSQAQSPHRMARGSTSGVSPTPERPRAPRRQPTREEQHQEMLRTFRSRYKIDVVPSLMQFKLSSAVSGYRLSADVCKPRHKDPYLSLGVKMSEDPLLCKKIVVTPQHSDIRVFTPAMEIGVLRLQFALGYDWTKRTFGASWRCKTKWTVGKKVQKRFKHYTSDNVEVATFWNYRSQLPTVGGSFGSNSSSVQTDFGRLHLDLDRLKTSVRLN